MEIKYIKNPPQGFKLLGAYPEIGELPTKWHGYKLKWESGYKPTPIFIGQFTIDRKLDEKVKVYDKDIDIKVDNYLFGFRIELEKAFCKKEKLLEGYFIEYLLIECYGNSAYKLHRLNQSNSAVFSNSNSKDDYEIAEKININDSQLFVKEPPKWKQEEAIWPTLNRIPMKFIKQWTVEENNVTRKYFTYDEVLFLFYSIQDSNLVFKITIQDSNIQTDKEHYEEEEMRGEW